MKRLNWFFKLLPRFDDWGDGTGNRRTLLAYKWNQWLYRMSNK